MRELLRRFLRFTDRKTGLDATNQIRKMYAQIGG